MLDVLIMLDTTGSMNPVAHETRQKVKELTTVLFNQSDVRVGIISHGDYCDRNNIYSLLNFTDDVEVATNHILNKMPKTSGGDADECYEYIYQIANGLQWRESATKIMVQFSDANPHAPSYNAKNYGFNKPVADWRSEIDELKKRGITLYALRCLGTHQNAYYATLAAVFGTQQLHLSNFKDTVESILLCVLNSQSTEQFDNYVSELKLNVGLAKLIDQLRGSDLSSTIEEKSASLYYDSFTPERSYTYTPSYSRKKLPEGLVKVEPGRFQQLTVDANQSIQDFVRSTGAAFRVGKGFYQLSKSEKIQENKEVILVDEFGQMFTGTDARNMIGVPFGKRGNVSSKSIPRGYQVFIQSTSFNRKLVKDTEFLYEV
jgi:hypothetical protein